LDGATEEREGSTELYRPGHEWQSEQAICGVLCAIGHVRKASSDFWKRENFWCHRATNRILVSSVRSRVHVALYQRSGLGERNESHVENIVPLRIGVDGSYVPKMAVATMEVYNSINV
jgi:hypothetical protein